MNTLRKEKKIPSFFGFNLETNERYQLAEDKRLFRIGVKLNTPNICNWACPYCYVGDESISDRPKKLNALGSVTHDLSKDKSWSGRMKSWIDQSIELGVKAVTINGTFEPTTSKDMYKILEFCKSRNLVTTLVTNGRLLKDEDIKRLYSLGVNILTKINVPFVNSDNKNYSLFCSIQKKLSGLKGDAIKIYEKQKELIQRFINVGFNKELPNSSTRLGVESVITNLNVEYLPLLIRQLRDLNIYAHIEVTKLQGFAKRNANLTIEKNKLEWLFKTVQSEDLEDGFDYYDIKPPYLGGTCYENLHRLDIHADGKVKPCPGIETVVGDLNKSPLKEIVNSLPVRIIRNLEDFIEGDCKNCELFKSRECYGGCRGTVYQSLKANGFSEYESWVGSDPSCWKVDKVLDNGKATSEIFNKVSKNLESIKIKHN